MDIYGNVLPTEARVGDVFHDQITNKTYIYDDGEWQEMPQKPETQVPTPTSSDNGKVLGVDEDGKYVLEDAPSSVPTPTAQDEGKVISVDNSGAYTLTTPSGGADVPTPTTADKKKTLKVKNTSLNIGYELVAVPDLPTPDAVNAGFALRSVNWNGTYQYVLYPFNEFCYIVFNATLNKDQLSINYSDIVWLVETVGVLPTLIADGYIYHLDRYYESTVAGAEYPCYASFYCTAEGGMGFEFHAADGDSPMIDMYS